MGLPAGAGLLLLFGGLFDGRTVTISAGFRFFTDFTGTTGTKKVEIKVLVVFHALFANEHGGSPFLKCILIIPHLSAKCQYAILGFILVCFDPLLPVVVYLPNQPAEGVCPFKNNKNF